VTALVHLTRLHFTRTLRTRSALAAVLLVPICSAAADLARVKLPLVVVYPLFAVTALLVISLQASGDRLSGLADGVRTTPAPDCAMPLSRLALLALLLILQSAVFGLFGHLIRLVG
jgi:hypothetical protein